VNEQALEDFVARWRGAGGSERANYQLFVNELATLLGLSAPHPAGDDERDNGYVFERRATGVSRTFVVCDGLRVVPMQTL